MKNMADPIKNGLIKFKVVSKNDDVFVYFKFGENDSFFGQRGKYL